MLFQLAAFKYLNKLHSCLKKWLKMKTGDFHFVQLNIFITSLCDSLLPSVAQISWILLRDKYCIKFWLISLGTINIIFLPKYLYNELFLAELITLFCLAVGGESARRVNRASGGRGGRSPPKVGICFKSGESLAKSAYFTLLALKEPLRGISSAPKRLESILT